MRGQVIERYPIVILSEAKNLLDVGEILRHFVPRNDRSICITKEQLRNYDRMIKRVYERRKVWYTYHIVLCKPLPLWGK